MKKNFIIPLIIAILLGFLSAQILYSQYKKNVTDSSYNAYMLQTGVYTSKETLEKAIKSMDNYLVTNEEDKYYVYVGITTDSTNAEKIKQIYKNKNIDIYVKPTNINNAEFISNLEQYDVLINGVANDENVLSINEVVLSSYEELVLGNK